MSAYAVRYFSASKGTEIDIEELHAAHLLNAAKKLRARIDAGNLNEEPNLVHPQELLSCLDAEIVKRGLDQPKEEAAS